MSNDDCLELKNIKYQTMLLNHSSNINESVPNITNIEDFLEKEKALNKKKQWSKLSSNSKLKKIKIYVESYAEKNNLSAINKQLLLNYLTTSLERKKLQKVKDVNYDIETGVIENIPNLIFNKITNKFTLKRKNGDKSILKSLAPKTHKKKNRKKKSKENKIKDKKNKTIKDKNKQIKDKKITS